MHTMKRMSLQAMRLALPTIIGLIGVLGRVDAAVVVVSPSSMGSWAFNHRDANGLPDSSANGVGAMVNGPAAPPLGTGSANLATGDGALNGDGSQELRNTSYAGVKLSSITSLSYSTYATLNNGQQFPYLALEIDPCDGNVCTGADGSYRMFFEPPYQTPSSGNPFLPDQGASVLNGWQTWDALAGGWWSNNGDGGTPGTGVQALSAFLALHPDAQLANTAGGLGAVQFRVGFGDQLDVFNGYVDNFTIGIDGVDTTYDFEATVVPVPAAAWLFGSALGLLGLRRRTSTG
ncbi:MAG: hypothetical protein JNK40_03555 [Chromatiales bacterium]|nr:hypothetical protein [Chromatiales bacterium]